MSSQISKSSSSAPSRRGGVTACDIDTQQSGMYVFVPTPLSSLPSLDTPVSLTRSVKSVDEGKGEALSSATVVSTTTTIPRLVELKDISIRDLVLNNTSLSSGSRSVLRGFLGKKAIKTTFGWASSFGTTAAGIVNSNFPASILPTTITEFVNWAALFDEFFIHRYEVAYKPFDRYQIVPATSPYPGTAYLNSVPLVAVSLHHGTASYGSMVLAYENALAEAHMTSDPFLHRWDNIESPNVATVVGPTTSVGTPTQGWCLTQSTAAAAYTGTIQMISSAVLGAPLNAGTIGQAFVRYYVSFRIRA